MSAKVARPFVLTGDYFSWVKKKKKKERRPAAVLGIWQGVLERNLLKTGLFRAVVVLGRRQGEWKRVLIQLDVRIKRRGRIGKMARGM